MLGKTISIALLAATAMLTAFVEAEAGVLEKVKESGVLTLGYRESSVPFAYLDANQKPVGFSMDLCAAVVEKAKSRLGLPDLKVEFLAVNASNRIPLLQNGTLDLECGSTTNTAERQKQVAFSVATFVSQPSWLTTTGSGIKSAADLAGKTVAITQGSLNLSVWQQQSTSLGIDVHIVNPKDQAESLLMLRTGRAAAWFEDNILQAGLAASSPEPSALTFLPDKYGKYYYYGLMLPRDDAPFKALVDGALADLMSTGQFDVLYAKWFTRPIPPGNQNLNLPMSDALKARVARPSDAIN